MKAKPTNESQLSIRLTKHHSTPLRESVRLAFEEYFKTLGGDIPADLHNLFLREVEPPMLEIVLQNTGNITKAATALGLNRATLRKKMRDYDIGGVGT